MSRSGPRSAVATRPRSACPPSVSAALGQEIDGLGELARRLAWGAAVAGDPADLELATAAAGLGEEQALAALEELVARDVLRATAVPRRYAFRHPIVRRAVYEAAGEAWRLGAHARAAAALAARPSAIAARAHHVERSRARRATRRPRRCSSRRPIRPPRERRRSPRAGCRRRCGCCPIRRRTPSAGSACSSPLATRAGGQRAPGGGARHAAADARADPAGAPELRVRLVAACASCENALGRHDAAHARLLHALAEFPDDGSAGGAALQVELAADALYDSDFAAMRRWGERRRRRRRRSAIPACSRWPRRSCASPSTTLGGAAQAEPARVASAAGLDALPDELLAARLDLPYYLGFAEYFCERYEDAARHFRRGIALARKVGQGQFVVSMMVGLAQALERLGRLREALSTAEAAVEASRLTGNRQAVGFALVAEAWTAAELGDVDHARAAAEEAVALLDALDESVFTRATHAHVGVIWLEIGEPDRCIEQLRAAGLPTSR